MEPKACRWCGIEETGEPCNPVTGHQDPRVAQLAVALGYVQLVAITRFLEWCFPPDPAAPPSR